MPITSKQEKVNEEGQEKEAYTFTFTNAAKSQLEELQKFFNAPTPLDVIKLGISFLQRLKEHEEKKANPNDETK